MPRGDQNSIIEWGGLTDEKQNQAKRVVPPFRSPNPSLLLLLLWIRRWGINISWQRRWWWWWMTVKSVSQRHACSNTDMYIHEGMGKMCFYDTYKCFVYKLKKKLERETKRSRRGTTWQIFIYMFLKKCGREQQGIDNNTTAYKQKKLSHLHKTFKWLQKRQKNGFKIRPPTAFFGEHERNTFVQSLQPPKKQQH